MQPTRSLRFELSLRRDTRAVGAGHRPVVAAPEQRSLASQSAERRRPLFHHRCSARPRHPERAGARRPPAGCSGRGTSISTSDDVAPVHAAGDACARRSPTGGGYAFDRLTLDFRRYSRLTPSLRVNARLRADGWIGGDRLPVQRRVSLGGPDLMPGYGFRAFTCAPRSFVDPSEPALCDRAIVAQLEVRTRLGLNLGYRMRDRESGAGGRFIGIEEADLVFLGDAGKAWLAGDGPGQVPVNRIPSLPRVEDRRGDRARRRPDRRLSREESRRRRAGAPDRPPAAPVLVRPIRGARPRRLAGAARRGRAARPRRGRGAAAAQAPPAPQPVRLTVRLAADSTPRDRARRSSARRTCWATAAGCPRCARDCRCGCITGWRSGARAAAGSTPSSGRRVGRGAPARAAARPVHAAHARGRPGPGAALRHARRARARRSPLPTR